MVTWVGFEPHVLVRSTFTKTYHNLHRVYPLSEAFKHWTGWCSAVELPGDKMVISDRDSDPHIHTFIRILKQDLQPL